MVTFKHKDTGRTKELPNRYGEGILLTTELARGFELVDTKKAAKVETESKEAKNEKTKLITVRKGSDEYKDLIAKASEKYITLDAIEEVYKISASIRKELEILLK